MLVHQIRDKRVGKHSFKPWPHLDPELLRLSIRQDEHTPAIVFFSDTHGSHRSESVLTQRNTGPVCEEEQPDIDPGFLTHSSQIILETNCFPGRQQAGRIDDSRESDRLHSAGVLARNSGDTHCW
jgi:hypothetical protein